MNVPAVFIITGALVAPALSTFVLKLPVSPVAVWAIESLLCQAIDCPTCIVVGFGAKDREAKSPWIDTVTTAEVVGVGVGDVGVGDAGAVGVDGAVGDVVVDEEPHAAAVPMMAVSERRMRVRFMMSIRASAVPHTRTRFAPHFGAADRQPGQAA